MSTIKCSQYDVDGVGVLEDDEGVDNYMSPYPAVLRREKGLCGKNDIPQASYMSIQIRTIPDIG